jgi:hypothetical protein
MFAGQATLDLVMQNLNSIGNVMNLEMNAHSEYNDLEWRIEAREDNKTVRV